MILPYQKAWLADESKFKIGMFARQTGKTFSTTLEIVRDILHHEANGKFTKWVIMSRSERQALEAMREGYKHLSVYREVLKHKGIELKYNEKKLEVEFKGGSRIIAVSSNPDTARGFSANVYLDEFAFHNDSKLIWKGVFPVISNGYKIRITSTPNGRDNIFYDLIQDKSGIWSKHIVDIYQAVKMGLNRDIDQIKKVIIDEQAFAQEFELKWIDESSSWLPYNLISSAEMDDCLGNYQNNLCYLGVDIGRYKDLFCVIVLEKIGDVLFLREIIERKNASFSEQDFILDRLMNSYRVSRCFIDRTGIGQKPTEDAIKKYGSMRIHGINFTSSEKFNLAVEAKKKFEERLIKIPMNHNLLKADLHSIKKTITMKNSMPSFIVDRGQSDGHADRAWALFLAISASEVPEFVTDYQTVNDLEDDDIQVNKRF